MKNYNNYILKNEKKDYFKKISDILLSDKFKDKTKIFLVKCKNEVDEYKEVGNILKRFSKGEKISKEDKKKVYQQLIDTLKIGGTASIFLLPFGSILLYGLIKIGKKFNINFLPSSWNNKLNENDKADNILVWALYNNNIYDIKKAIDNGANINLQDDIGYTILMKLAIWLNYVNRNSEKYDELISLIIEVIDLDADWNIVNIKGKDFMDFLENTNIKYKIIERYPEKYKKYLRRKKMNNFNI